MIALVNCDIYTGSDVVYDKALLIKNGKIFGLCNINNIPNEAKVIDLGGRSVASGFIDCQVNGGGGLLFNDSPTKDTVDVIYKAHLRFGTTNILPTIITANFNVMEQAALTVQSMVDSSHPGVIGIHFEGPFINTAKAGVHDVNFVRPPNIEDIRLITGLKNCCVMATVALESIGRIFLEEIRKYGVKVSIGHSNATYSQVAELIDQIDGFTHLFNAMSGVSSREPGVSGAALSFCNKWASIIVDGNHVHPANIDIAHRLIREKLFLVTDAMPPVGSSISGFRLGDIDILVENGRCVTKDGVLGGSALDMATAIRNCIQKVGIPKDEALRMGSTYPAEFLGIGDQYGYIKPNYTANLAIFDNEIYVSSVIVGGQLIDIKDLPTY